MNYYNQTQNQHSNFINLETPSQPKKPLLLGVNEIQNSNMNPRQNSNYPQKQNSSSYQLPPDQQNLSTDYQNNQNLQVASQFNSHDYACNYGEYQQIGQGNSVSGQQMIPQNQLLQAGQIYLVKMLPVSCRVNTVPQMYQVREEVKSGLFRSDEVLTKKINVTNISQYQVPFEFKINREYKLRFNIVYLFFRSSKICCLYFFIKLREDELRQSPDKDRSANGMSDSDYDQRSRTLQKTRGRPPAPTSFGQKQKRVTMPQPQLQENLFRLFKDTQEFKIHELEVILNHPRGTLKETLTQMCRYDNKRKVYSLREDFQP